MIKGIYIHIPFCKRKCKYCSFYSSVDVDLKSAYLNALEREIFLKKRYFPNFFHRCNDYTLYIGGGNPALLNEWEWERLFQIITAELNFTFSEITVELNPEDVTLEKLMVLKSYGVNRISLGIQSFSDLILSFLGRGHNKKQSLKAIENVADNFNNYSIDIMGGIPNIERDWNEEFVILKKVKPSHISFYLLTIEEGVDFYGKITTDDDQCSNEYFQFCDFAASEMYEHYEISNFCKKGHYARHNMIYWDGGDYIGFGPSAVSFFNDEMVRIKNISSLSKYLKQPDNFETERLSEKDVFLEKLFLPLRTSFGLNTKEIGEKYPHFFEKIKASLFKQREAGFLLERGGKLVVPQKYQLLMNEIVLNIVKEL